MSETGPLHVSTRLGLSARLLVLTVAFIMVSEFLIYAPSIARFRKVYLEDHITKARLATLALEAVRGPERTRNLELKVLAETGAYAIVLTHAGRRELSAVSDMPPMVDAAFDVGDATPWTWLRDGFEALVQRRNRVLRLVGPSPDDPAMAVEVVIDESPMREAMYGYSNRILQLSIVISLITGALLYFSLQLMLVRPMRRITEALVAFREDPEDISRSIVPGDRSDEIGRAQRELAAMQDQVRAALRQKTRLATLGAAVAKINHDLRNSLATAVLVSDRLADIDDPEVKRVTPRLYDAIDRAVNLCSQTLAYVADSNPPLKRSRFDLAELAQEAGEAVLPGTTDWGSPRWRVEVARGLEMEADREQMFRVFTNLGRNALEAGAANVRISARTAGGRLAIDVADDGPGLTPRARENLFRPFAGPSPAGGTGLGLVIVRDIMRAHGGDVTLMRSGDGGTIFRLDMPRGRA